MRYRYNPYCSCARCRAHGYMGPAVLITLGVLFLLAQVGDAYWLNFDRTWPALLIVIGLVSFLRHSAPVTGHIPREYAAPPAGGYRQAPYGQALSPSLSGAWNARVSGDARAGAVRGEFACCAVRAEWDQSKRYGGAQWLAPIRNLR